MSDVLAPFLVGSTHYVVKEDTSVYGGLNLISGYGIHSSLDEALATAEKSTGGSFMTFVGNTTDLIPFTVEGSEGEKYAVSDNRSGEVTKVTKMTPKTQKSTDQQNNLISVNS